MALGRTLGKRRACDQAAQLYIGTTGYGVWQPRRSLLKPARPADSPGVSRPAARPCAYEVLPVGPGPAGTEEGAILSNIKW